MSFVYARKQCYNLSGKNLYSMEIYSDTKISLLGTSNANWGNQTKKSIEKYGLVKSIIVSSNCCISFAGNNIMHAHTLLSLLYDKKQVDIDDLIQLAFKIHLEAPYNEIEFIICFAKNEVETEIICIKNGEVYRDCSIAWIGSYKAFRCLQEYLLKDTVSSQCLSFAFEYAISHCGDDTVGGFNICVRLDNTRNRFIYAERFISVTERQQRCLVGEKIKISGNSEEGAYTAIYHESEECVMIEILQANTTIMYTNKIRLQVEDSYNMHTRHFLLPISIETNSLKVKHLL